MDFEPKYTKEQEEFRKEVREWLKENMPEGLYKSVVPEEMDEAMYQRQRELGRRLGAKGWLRPMYPKEYGGRGMSPEEALVIVEELDEGVIKTVGFALEELNHEKVIFFEKRGRKK